MAKITELTPAQGLQLVAWRETWRAIGIRTGHDAECESTGRSAINDAYQAIGEPHPPLVLWARSPLQGLLMYWAVRLLAHGREQAPTGGEVQLGDQLRDQLGDQLRDQLRDQLWGQLGDQLWGQLRDQLGGQIRDQLWGQIRDQLKEAYGQVWSWGQCEGYWTAWYRFAIQIGVKVTEEQDRRLTIWERLVQSAFTASSWRGITVLVEHPSIAKFDAEHRLHCVDGPALAWSDGYALYAINGIRLSPERGAEMAAGKLTAAQIRNEPNAEVRRVMIAQYCAGDTGRYMRDVGAAVIHTDVDNLGNPRRLLRLEQHDDEPALAIEVTNSTPEPDGTRKIYTFRCHPELRPLPIGPRSGKGLGEPQMLTCLNAIASTYGRTGPEYLLAIET